MTVADAYRIAAALDLDVDEIGICLACLSFVSFAMDAGDERKIRGEVRRMAPILWEEGLELPARRALERARDGGLEGAEDALHDVLTWGGRSLTAEAIVRRLGADLAERAQGNVLRMGFEPWPPPSLN